MQVLMIKDANGRKFPVSPNLAYADLVGENPSSNAAVNQPQISALARFLIPVESVEHPKLTHVIAFGNLGNPDEAIERYKYGLTVDGSFDASLLTVVPAPSGSSFDELAVTTIAAAIAVDTADDSAFAYVPDKNATLGVAGSPAVRDAYATSSGSVSGSVVNAIEKLSLGVIAPPLELVICELALTGC